MPASAVRGRKKKGKRQPGPFASRISVLKPELATGKEKVLAIGVKAMPRMEKKGKKVSFPVCNVPKRRKEGPSDQSGKKERKGGFP